MELILLSVIGIASLFSLEFFSLFYDRWVREPQLTSSEVQAARGALATGQSLSCSEAANDADATTIVRVRARRAHYESVGE